MKKLNYTIDDATISQLLGVQNFEKKESAILELVKNAYDAKAENVFIRFSNDRSAVDLVIEDDGHGMNSEDIERHWMFVGKSEKGYSIEGTSRVYAGSKGVGRFALARLGSSVTILSKKSGYDGIVWNTDWTESFLDELKKDNIGTRIEIRMLNDKWTKPGIKKLIVFLSKVYKDTDMKIHLEYDNEVSEIENFYKDSKLGIDHVAKIAIFFNSMKKQVRYVIVSDEFKKEISSYIDVNLKDVKEQMGVQSVLKDIELDLDEDIDAAQVLEELGNFSAVIHFRLSSISDDVYQEFMYKYKTLIGHKESGIALYRNAFSINAYDGSVDWLKLNSRARRSPAAATHETGSWRVRANQVFGYVLIDKLRNKNLRDLANRQSIEQSYHFQALIKIIDLSLKQFEKQRQSIIRKIDQKNSELLKVDVEDTEIIDQILKGKTRISSLNQDEQDRLVIEVNSIINENVNIKKEIEKSKESRRYEVSILKVLATIGLARASFAHEVSNRRTQMITVPQKIRSLMTHSAIAESIIEISEDVIDYKLDNVESLLDTNESLMVLIMKYADRMLEQTAIDYYEPKMTSIYDSVKAITDTWKQDYKILNVIIN